MKKYLIVLLCIILALSLGACGSDQNSTSGEGQLQPITVILDYMPNTNHTGLYAALDLGYYEEQGLDVRIIEPTEGAVLTLIAAGKGDFGVSYQEDVTYALTAEEPLPVKAIAAIIQHNTSGFASYKDKNILSPKDFEGKVYAGWGSPSEEAVIKAVMKKAGADFSKLSIITSDGSGYNVLKDKVDLIWLFWAWDGIAAEIAGIPMNYIELKELDPRLDYYTPVLVANNDTIENNPEHVEKFMAATTKGYEYAIENPEDAAQIIHKYAPDYDIEMLTRSQKYLADKYSEGVERWGVMKDEVWDGYTEFMYESGLIKEMIPASDCYTNQFLK
ncbi:MAG: ABC transporter substrate-binding protein [Anaerovoracaceae bacterium]|jgi:ABC-type nitrate/sulfonate/bicarbonate transport system substrate-binding protein|nr:ABC transporter substrate-binding protein [Clostridiales bacterium]